MRKKWESMDRYKEFFKPPPVDEKEHKLQAERGVAQIGIGLLKNMTNLIMQGIPAPESADGTKTGGSGSKSTSPAGQKETPKPASNPLASLFGGAKPQPPRSSAEPPTTDNLFNKV